MTITPEKTERLEAWMGSILGGRPRVTIDGVRRVPASTPAEMRAQSLRDWGDPPEPKGDARGLTDWGEVIKHGMAARDRKVEAWLTSLLIENGIGIEDREAIRTRCVLVQRDAPHKYDESGGRLYDEEGPGEMWLEIDGKRVAPSVTYSGEVTS